jgi:hypothetical protein
LGYVNATGPDRFDPSYFTSEYQERYDTPGSAALALEQSLQDADDDLMSELVATRDDPSEISARPDLFLYDLRNQTGGYYHYLYTTQDRTFRRIEHIKFENGRYLVVEEDLYYLVDSGKWPESFAPLLVTYYVLLLLIVGVTRLSRRSSRSSSG